MKKISRFLALLLALVMLMLPFAAFAADFSTDLQSLNKADYDKILEYVLNGQFKEAADRIFQQLTGIETADALYDALIGLGVDYDLLSNAQLNQLIALLEEMRTKENYTDDEISTEESEIDFAIKSFTKVAGFKAPVTGTALMRMLAAANDAQQDDNGVVLKKTATDNGDGTYTIRMEVYATGEKTTSTITEEIPTDIILVLDQSGSMGDTYSGTNYYSYTELEDKRNINAYEKKDTGLYYKTESGDYIRVSIARTDAGLGDETTYTEYMNQKNSTYYTNRDNLYEKVGDGYQKITVNREGNNNNRSYTFTFADGTSITDRGPNSHPDFNGKTVYLQQTLPIYKYTYTYTVDGDTVTLSESIGSEKWPILKDTENTPLVLYTRTFLGRTKLAALKSSVESFVQTVADKAADGINHRIAVVGFASKSDYGNNTELLSIAGRNSGSVGVAYNSITDQNLKDVLQSMNTEDGRRMVNRAVDALAAQGATRIDLGMDMAERILNANPVPEGEKRNRVVVVFTDGSPTDTNGFKKEVANNAITNATQIKARGTTVYTIGIFSGADATSAGTEPNGDLQGSNAMAAACNWFMQKLSSNDGTPSDPSYYLTPTSEGGLNAIFKQISSQIETGGSSTTLEEETKVNDYLTPQFYLPEDMTADNVKLESWKLTGVDPNGEYTWAKNDDAMGAVATIDKTNEGKHGVSVTGFNFSANWCGKETDAAGNITYHGNKLVIEFTAYLKEGFLGGDGVITNTDDSGVYDKDGNSVEKFEKPDVDVPTDPETIAINANVFLGGYYKEKITPENIKAKTEVEIKGTKLDLTKDNYGLEPWQREYIEGVDVSLTDKEGKEITEIPQLENDFTYTATVTVKLKPDQDGKQTTVTKTDNGTIYVFKPEVTYKDTESNVGADLRGYVDNYVSTRWKNSKDQYSDDPAVKMVAGVEAPELIFTYAPSESGTLGDENHPLVNNNLPVQVSEVEININGTLTDVLKDTTFIRNACTICGFVAGTVDTTGTTWTNFVIHVLTGNLTIIKEGCDEDLDPNQSFVFTVSGGGLNGQTIEVVIRGNGSVTIQDLPCGDYTVTENTDWSWRYMPDGGATKTVTVTGTGTEVTFNNSRTKDKWLDGNAYCENQWKSNWSN